MQQPLNLNTAVQIVQNKFNAEMKGNSEGPELDAYQTAFDKFPVMMEVATYCFSDQIVQSNYEARKAAAIKQAQEQAAQQPGENGTA